MSLTPKQSAFVQEYLIDLNATQAAIRAGYSPKTANEQAARLLAKASVSEAIREAMQARQTRTQADADRIIQEVQTLALVNIDDLVDFDTPASRSGWFRLKQGAVIPKEARRCIAAIKVKRYMEGRGDDAEEVEVVEFKLWDKVGAARLLMQHLGLLVDRHEVRMKGNLEIEEIVEHAKPRPVDRPQTGTTPSGSG